MTTGSRRCKPVQWLLATHLAACAAFAAVGNDEKCPVSANVRGHENIEWSISYAYGLTDIAGIDLATTMLEEDVDGDIEGQPRLRGIEGNAL